MNVEYNAPDKRAPIQENPRVESDYFVANASGTTNIEDQAVSKTTSYTVKDYERDILSSASTNYEQGIREFLAKPYRAAFGEFSPTTTPLPSFMMQLGLNYGDLLSANPVWKDKLKGFLGIRATLVCRLLVNGNPFQQGRLVLFYQPMYDELTGLPTNMENYNHIANLTTVSALPHVELDIACDTESVLEIPYISLMTHHNMLTNQGGWGRLFLAEWLPFNYGSGSSAASWELWISLKDVELVAPSVVNVESALLQAQMAPPKRKTKKRPDPSDQEIMQRGPVESFLNATSSVADTLSNVPILSSIAGPVSWAAGIASNIAGYFGWSRPLSQDARVVVNRSKYQQTNVADQKEVASTLGLFSTNKVRIEPSFGGLDMDEMSIDYIKQVYGVVDSGSWPTTSTSGTLLWSFNLKPVNAASSVVVAGDPYLAPTSLAFLGGMFDMWRGGFKIRFKFAKTNFHSGRLVLAFTPGFFNDSSGGAGGALFPANLQATDYLHREFIDLRTGHEFEFIVPFVSLYPYLQLSQDMGSLSLYVMNPLKGPDTVAQSVSYTIEMAGAEDMEFARPINPVFVPAIRVASFKETGGRKLSSLFGTWRKKPSAVVEDYPLEAQMETGTECKVTVAKPIGGSGVKEMNTCFAEVCIGEQIKSVKQLMLRTTFSTPSIGEFGPSFRPFQVTPASSTGDLYPGFMDWYSVIAPAFAYARGSMIVRLCTDSTNVAQKEHSIIYFNNYTNVLIDPKLSIAQSPFTPIVNERTENNILSCHFPQYTNAFGRLVSADGFQVNANYPFRSVAMGQVDKGLFSDPAIPLQLGRCVGDDTQLSFYLGPPLCVDANV
jgi:hypothetical protein